MSDYSDDFKGTAEGIERRFKERVWIGIREKQMLKPDDVKKIVELSY